MKILVCITHVPDTTSKIAFINNSTSFDKTDVQYIVGPYDDYALSRAVELRDQLKGTLTVLNVGMSETESSITKSLAIGADDAIRVDAEPKDAYFVAKQIASVAEKKNYDLIMMGRESIDFQGGHVHGMVGELLNIPSFSPVISLNIDNMHANLIKEIEGGKEHIEVSLPIVVGCQEPIAEWKIPNIRGIMTARKKPLEILAPVETNAGTSIKSFESLPKKTKVKMIEMDQIDILVELLKKEVKVI